MQDFFMKRSEINNYIAEAEKFKNRTSFLYYFLLLQKKVNE